MTTIRRRRVGPRARLLVPGAVLLLSLGLVLAGVVLIMVGPPAERLAESSGLAAASTPTDSGSADGPGSTPSSVPSVASRSGRTPSARSAASRWRTHPARPTVEADHHGRPVRLDVPALRLTLPVRATGVDEHGAMALPDRPSEVGWYRFGSRPGDAHGTTVLGGHVDSVEYGTGPLVGLWRLRPGDRLMVVTATGRTTAQVTYEVTAVQRIAKRAVDPDEVFRRDGRPTLRLITCGGEYDPSRGGYQDNVVVTARRR